MKFTVSDKIFVKYPNAIIGVIVAKDIDNHGETQEVNQLLRREENRIKNDFNLENLSQNPLIMNWRKAYKSFGSDDRCSSEALIRVILKGGQIRHINKLVDIYNYISIKYRTPVGGEDLTKIQDNIQLKFADGNEKFILLNEKDIEYPKPGEVIYADDKEAICRKWNWRESDNTKLTEETEEAFLVIDALPPITEQIVKEALKEFASLVEKFCNATTKTFILTKDSKQIEW